ncbi:zonadhesin-like [Saccoglossus kowalevskii]|uniref:IgGFc-binding protein-like n=1 Tax=Saccoglossus kowalevskii TaxID=10224 RepID=A0A0U2US31_SACKO|nr:PREDICTED: IgGFc-binding protein-like [Saccoglossus kowalevskii]ALR88614.1 von Willebrand type d domain protein-like m7 [Saccoglossus kowalevskii]
MMLLLVVITIILGCTVNASPRHIRQIDSTNVVSVTRFAKYDVVVTHTRLGDCSYKIEFIRADTTTSVLAQDIIIHWAIDDSVYLLEVPVVTGSTTIEAGKQSAEILWTPPNGFVPPYDVTGVTQITNDEGGTVDQHQIDDGVCTPGSTRGDPHMRSFDGHGYSFQGLCWYTLAKHCTENPDFEVTAEFAPRPSSGDELKTRAVRLNVTVGDERLSMDTTNEVLVNDVPLWAAKLNGSPVNFEIITDPAMVGVKIERFNMDILWEGRKHAFSAVVSHPDYHGNICGLLGNADGDPLNDFQKPDGTRTTHVNEFGESWKVNEKTCEY